MAKVTGPDKPYAVWSADIHQCQNCQATIICQTGHRPIWNHYEKTDIPPVTHRVWEFGMERSV
jgi:hypothetical protein